MVIAKPPQIMSLKAIIKHVVGVVNRHVKSKIFSSSIDLGNLFHSFNKSLLFQPLVKPVGRKREVQLVLETSLDNWSKRRLVVNKKLKTIYAPQSQGSGKTFLVQYLREFMVTDMNSNDSVVNRLLKDPRYSHLASHITALSTTRSIVIPLDKLSKECVSFEEAVVVEVVSQLCGKYPKAVLQKVRARDLRFPELCDELLARNGALIIVLDDVMDLALSEHSAHLAWLRSGALLTDTQEQRTRAAMTLLKELLQSVLCRPGALLYLTGRASDSTYQLLANLQSSPLLARAVLLDAMQHLHIVDMLTLTGFEGSEVKMWETIGLCSAQEVSELAWWALLHTGGVPRVLACAISELRSGEYLRPERRSPDQSVWDVLSSRMVSDEIYCKVRNVVPQGIGPNLTRLDAATDWWDKDLATASLLRVLDAAGDGATVACLMQVEVAPGKRVDAVDLLSVLGVPFRRSEDDDGSGSSSITVHLGAWSLRAMLEARTVRWAGEELQRQVKWMREERAAAAAASDDNDVDKGVDLARIGLQAWADEVPTGAAV